MFAAQSSLFDQSGPAGLLGGLLLHDFARAREVLRFYRDFPATAVDEISTDAVLLTTA